MNYISLILCCAILSTVSAAPIKAKLCLHCKHFKKNFFQRDKFGKCNMFPIVENDEYFLVDGIKNTTTVDYHYCSVSRLYDEMCGKDGIYYEQK